MAAHGRYAVVRKIADGGMAEIFLGRQHGAEGFERPVVLKRILTAFYADPQFRNLLIDEAHVAMSLLHGNIVQVLDLGQAAGRYFLVMELVDGWDLNQVTQRARAVGAPFPAELALYVIAEVCRGLHYAHSKTKDGKTLGIVHRDVSPHNVLLSEQGEVKLTDFGIAKALGKRDRTGTGVIKGKLAFMSPEQASGAVLDRRSDLFSVGTMLYVLACGKKPFAAATDLESMLRIQRADFPAPETVVPGLAPELGAVLRKAMRLLPSERYQTAEEMLEDVERVQRAAFRPAGQTELKRWLAELSRSDGAVPVSRQAAPPQREPSAEPVDGLDVVLEDEPPAEAVGATLALSTPPPVSAGSAAPPGPWATGSRTRSDRPGSGSRPAPPAASDAAAGAPGGRRRTPALLGVLLLGSVAIAAAYWVSIREISSPIPGVTAIVRVAAAADAAATQLAAPVTDTAPAADAAELADAWHERSDALGAEVPGIEEEPGEDELLRQAEKGASEKVIGEEEEKVAAQGRAGLPAQTVSLKVSSRPDGAVVRIGKRVLGRTPINLRFRSGIEYDIALVKTGYVTATKRVKVTARKQQSLAVALKKRPPPSKSKGFLQKIFSGSGERGKR